MAQLPEVERLRTAYQLNVKSKAIFLKGPDKDVPSIADTGSPLSIRLAQSLCKMIPGPFQPTEFSGQTAGSVFEEITAAALDKSFRSLHHLRPGTWEFSRSKEISEFEQYKHLAELDQIAQAHEVVRTALGDYLIKADIVLIRDPLDD